MDSGVRVLLSDLNSRPELNGTHGTILAFHAEKGRFAVKLSSNSEKILLRAANLTSDPAPRAPAKPAVQPLARTGGSWDDLGEQQLMMTLSEAERALASKPQRAALMDALNFGLKRNKLTVLANPPRYDRLALRTLEHGGQAIYTVEAGLDEWEGTGWWTTVDWSEEEVASSGLVPIDDSTLAREYTGVLCFLEGCRRLGSPRYTTRTSLDPNAKPHVLLVVERVLADSSLRCLLAEDALERADSS